MLFPKNIVFGNNLYAFWHNQHKLPYRCSGYLQLPRSFGVRKENPAANKSNERIRRTKAHRNACRQKRLRLQDIYQILQKGVKARRFHTFFLSFTTLLPSSFIHRIIESTENFREKQRNLEKFREIRRYSEMGIQILIVGRFSLCNFASTNQNNLKLCTKLKSLKILISVRFARQLERMARLSSVPLMFAEH